MARCRWAGTNDWVLTGRWAAQVLTGIEPEAAFNLKLLGPIYLHVGSKFRSRRATPGDLALISRLPHRSHIIRVNRFYVTRPKMTLESCSLILSYNATAKSLTRYKDRLDEIVQSLEDCEQISAVDASAIRADFDRRTESLRTAATRI